MSTKNLTLSKDLPYDLKVRSIEAGNIQSGSYTPTISAVGGSRADITGATIDYAEYILVDNVCSVNLEIRLPNGTNNSVSVFQQLGIRVSLPFTPSGLVGGTTTFHPSSISPTNGIFGLGNVTIISPDADLNNRAIISAAGPSADLHIINASFSYTIL